MKTYYIFIISVAIIIITGLGMLGLGYNIGYDKGYETGKREIPPNVLEISDVNISYHDGYYEFTVTSGNNTFNIAKIPTNHSK